MTTYVIAWSDNGVPRPVGTVSSVDSGKEWCQWQANQLAEDVLPPLKWSHHLSRGTGPGTAHYTADSFEDIDNRTDVGTFEVWVLNTLEGK